MEFKDKIEFEVSGKDFTNVKKFRKQHKNCNMGMTAEQFEYSFTPTSLGLMATIKCSCGRSMTIGNFMDREAADYDEEKYKVLTEQDRKNAEFEDAVRSILILRKPQMFRIAFRKPITFELLYAYMAGFIKHADERLGEAFLYKYDMDKYHNEVPNYKGCSEEVKIEKFFEYFINKIKEEISKYDCRNEQLIKELNISR